MKVVRSALTLAFSLASFVAFAQGPSEIEIKNAQARFDEGRVLAGKGQYEEARVKFVQAWAVLKSPDVLYNLALAEKKSVHPVDAARHFRQLIKDPSTPKDLLDRAKKYIDELSSATARITVHAPNGADVMVDGTTVGRAPIEDPVDVLPGHSVVSIALEGKTAERDVTVAAGESTELTLSLPSDAITGGPGGTSNGNPPPPVTTRARPTAGFVVPIVLGVAGIGALAAGIGTGAASSGIRDGAISNGRQGACATLASAACVQARNDWSSVSGLGAASVALYVGGGVLVAASIVAFLVWPKTAVRDERGSLYVAPGAGSFMFGGTFQ
jgi:hypothetical protein